MRNPLSLSVLCTLALPLAAQTTVVPSKYATIPSGNFTAYPFGLGTPVRVQYFYASNQVALPVVVVKQLAIRGFPTSPAPAKSNVDMEIGLTTTQVDPANAST